MHYSQAQDEWTPVSLDDCKRNNRLQITQSINGAGPDTLRALVADLRERIARDVATLEEAEDQLRRREGR